MTPDTQAAAERVRQFLDAWGDEHDPYPNRELSTVVVGTGQFIDLTSTDLRTLLAALDPADQPANRHQPLTDQPSGVTTTERGRQAVIDYRAIRREHDPRPRP